MHQYSEKNVLKEEITFENYYSHVLDVNLKRGINASSISDVSNIPRATVIRKLKWLSKKDVIKRNKSLEYQLKNKGKLNKTINENLKLNQGYVADFLTDIFDYMKNSAFKI